MCAPSRASCIVSMGWSSHFNYRTILNTNLCDPNMLIGVTVQLDQFPLPHEPSKSAGIDHSNRHLRYLGLPSRRKPIDPSASPLYLIISTSNRMYHLESDEVRDRRLHTQSKNSMLSTSKIYASDRSKAIAEKSALEEHRPRGRCRSPN